MRKKHLSGKMQMVVRNNVLQNYYLVLCLLRDLLLHVMEEHHGEDGDAHHHAEGRGIAQVARDDEPLYPPSPS